MSANDINNNNDTFPDLNSELSANKASKPCLNSDQRKSDTCRDPHNQNSPPRTVDIEIFEFLHKSSQKPLPSNCKSPKNTLLPSNTQKMSILKCEEHSLKLDFYCTSCRVFTCAYCQLADKHRSHSYKTLKETLDEKKAAFEVNFQEVSVREREIQASLKQIGKYKTSINSQVVNVTSKINEVLQTITDRATALLSKLNDIEMAKISELSEKEDALLLMLSNCNKLTHSLSQMKRLDDESFVLNLANLEDLFNEFTKNSEIIELSSIDDCKMELKLNEDSYVGHLEVDGTLLDMPIGLTTRVPTEEPDSDIELNIREEKRGVKRRKLAKKVIFSIVKYEIDI